MPVVRIEFQIQDAAGKGIPGRITSTPPSSIDPGPWTLPSDPTGKLVAFLEPGKYHGEISAPGYVTASRDWAFGNPTPIGQPVRIGLERASSSIRIQGIDFVDAAGHRLVFNGTDQFLAYRQFLDGADLEPAFAESKSFNFNCWRVFLMGSKAQNQVMDLKPSDAGYYEKLLPFAQLLNSRGILLLATVFVDAQDVLPNVAQQQQHWQRMTAFASTNTLLSLGNEWHKNGFDPGNFSALSGLVCSRGSDLSDAAPFKPYWNFAEFHPRRDMPTSVMDTVASPVFIHGSGGLAGPLFIDEPPKFGTNGSSAEFVEPFTAYRFARHYATECGGACFHNFFGQRGQLMDGQTQACASAWSRGMQL